METRDGNLVKSTFLRNPNRKPYDKPKTCHIRATIGGDLLTSGAAARANC